MTKYECDVCKKQFTSANDIGSLKLDTTYGASYSLEKIDHNNSREYDVCAKCLKIIHAYLKGFSNDMGNKNKNS